MMNNRAKSNAHPTLKLSNALKEQEQFLQKAVRRFRENPASEFQTSAAQWLLDNLYVVQQTQRQIREDMPPGFYRRLPTVVEGPLQGHLRIYRIARQLVVDNGGLLNADGIEHTAQAVRSYTGNPQTDAGPTILTIGELWALPVMLRLCILQCLTQAACRITGTVYEGSLPAIPLPPELKDDQVVANAILSLRALAMEDWQSFFEDVSEVEHILRSDPAGAYAAMDTDTRNRYRKVIEQLARATGKDEPGIACQAVALAQGAFDAGAKAAGAESPRLAHVGYYLIDEGRLLLEAQLNYPAPLQVRIRRWARHHPTPVYLGGITLISLIVLLAVLDMAAQAGATPLQLIIAGLLSVVPAASIAVGLTNWMVTLALPPRVLPKMDFAKGIPAEYQTLVVVPALLSSAAEVNSLLKQIELHYLRNPDPYLSFALLTDFPDAPQQHLPGDDALIEQAANGIRRLNRKYLRERATPFYILNRERRWNANEARWMGWERKRGKLQELNHLLRRDTDTSYTVQIGDLSALPAIKYVITLDADTLLLRQGAQRLVATLAHPLNQAEFNAAGQVTAGYTLLQPRIEITPVSAGRSLFTRIFAGDVGLDLYTHAVSDVYQDLFGTGIYIGKGIYDVDAFERSLKDRIPENALLSHDLFEGIHGRVGLATDIVMFEDYPPHYLVYMRRSSRWIRGDWQLLPWLLPRVRHAGKGSIPNILSVIDKWKILDNLRRSLLAPMLLLLFMASWLWLPGSIVVWTLFGVLTPAVPLIAGALSSLVRNALARNKPSGEHGWLSIIKPLQDSVLRWLLELAFLPYETFLVLGGILVTLVRVVVTRRNLLEWVTAAQAARESGYEISWRVVRKRMTTAFLYTAVVATLMAFVNPPALIPALPLLLVWLLSPEIAYLISLPTDRAPEALSEGQQQLLRKLARRTWLFFEQFVGPEDHWLPPDHFQELPLGQVTPHTSPTNIGLLMLSTLSAYDFGYIGLQELATRLQLTFESLDKLERHRGHLLNWYDTRSMQPLGQRYISTVDSGNFAACLIALKQGMAEVRRALPLRWQFWEGWLDTLDMLAEAVAEFSVAGVPTATSPLQVMIEHLREAVWAVKETPAAWAPLMKSIAEEGWPELNRALSAFVSQEASEPQAIDARAMHRLPLLAHRVRNHLDSVRRETETLLPPGVFEHAPFTSLTLNNLPAICQSILSNAPGGEDIHSRRPEELTAAATEAQALLGRLKDIEQRAESYLQEMDFAFLFDVQRRVFYIGYNVETARLDNNHYDLLASEARIASLVAIAKNDVPSSHWLYLGRALTEVDGTRCLLSWSATMFEYLMPSLLMRSLDGTLLQESGRAAVRRQIAFATSKHVPWGISEAGFYAFDAAMNYQYRAFGVPGLGFKRELADDLVIAPYASLLALRYNPRAVTDNITRLIELQMLGPHGFYESIDYTPSHLPLGESHAVVRSYMAHHQGMILVALANHLHGDVMVNRLHADPRIQSVEMLLQEKVPYDVPLELPQSDEGAQPARVRKPLPVVAPWRVLMVPPVPQVHFLSNGRYGTLLTSAGGGVSRWQNLDLTRWSPDAALESTGTWLYVQEELPDYRAGPLWSATFQPARVWPESEHVDFHPHMVEFSRDDHGIALRMRVTVAPDEDVEIRRVLLTNRTDEVRRLRLTSYGEVVLAPHMDDLRHPAFSKLFIESEYVTQENALLFHRRPRSQEDADKPLYLAHCVIAGDGAEAGTHETDRARFLGRAGTPQAPVALTCGDPRPSELASEHTPSADGNGIQAPLDPIFSLSQTIELPPHGSAQVAFITLVADSRPKALALAARYRAWNVIDLAFTQAEVRARLELNDLKLGSEDLEQTQQLLSALLYPGNALRADAATIAMNQKGQNGLWAFGISGDNPILLLRLTDVDDLALAETLLRAHTYWRNRQLKIDMVILNRQGTTYGQELNGALQRLLALMHSEIWLNLHGGIFMLNEDQIGEATRVLLETSASAIIDSREGSLAAQLEAMHAQPNLLPQLMPTLSGSHGMVPSDGSVEIDRPKDLQFDNGWGGFSADGREYVIFLRPGQPTPAPWVNVVSNPDFGFIVTESGAGYTWAGNSSENRLTPWSNDPVLDPPGEALYLRDEETVEVWSPTPAPCPADTPYLIRHGAGYTTFEHHSHDLKQRVRMFVAADDPIKIVQLRLENTSTRTRRITATFYLEWVLGTTREATHLYLAPEFDDERQTMLVRNPYSLEFGSRVAFAAASKPLHGLTADRASFLGRMGSLSHPDALQRIGLNGRVQPGLDPCVALQVHMDLQPGESEEVNFLLGQGANRYEAMQLADRYREPARVQTAWQTATGQWNSLLSTVQVHTPEPAMDLLLNRWLLYPTLACRVWGRSAFYQPGGAFGFRDQLQDVMALVDAAPLLAREHILHAAQYQFEEGDVLHWWHPPFGRGVRTRYSDDLLWLPFVTAHYVAVTGDESILNERAASLSAPPLDKKEVERYSVFPATGERATLLEHCQRAIEKGSTSGAHGLPLMGGGDWNDGMNRVGIGGTGESVWLGWFLYATLDQFAALCQHLGRDADALMYRQRASKLRTALEAQAWDGQWYLRAFYDDGTRLGSASNTECQIDSIAQSWAALSGAGEPAHVAQAMQSVVQHLERDDDQLLLLLTPPFAKTLRDPGYIKGYVPGIRENGGQYTHAAIWSAWAFAALGDGDKAEALFRLLNPIHHANTPGKAARYKVEPYVVAADVYSAPPHTGRGGWTWYTGSNAWMYRLGLDAILGIRRKDKLLHIDPCIPIDWPGYQVTYRYGATTYEITVNNGAHVNQGVKGITLDGQALPANQVPLLNDGVVHQVQVWLGAREGL